MTADKRVDEYFNKNLKWTVTDFFYAYCEAKGIEDPETDLSDEEYTRLEKIVEDELTPQFLSRLRDSIIEEAQERIFYAMNSVVVKRGRYDGND